ncbi:MAG: hypothetical protein M5U32_11545 [Myxococcota bacterium]|nr:hypothetical protein [Myxococcota bacterium]
MTDADEQPAGDADDDDPEALGRTDSEALRALAAAVIENAIYYATSMAGSVTAAEREDARSFLLDPTDPRLDSWVSVLGLDPDALRDRLRPRLRHRGDRAA